MTERESEQGRFALNADEFFDVYRIFHPHLGDACPGFWAIEGSKTEFARLAHRETMKLIGRPVDTPSTKQ